MAEKKKAIYRIVIDGPQEAIFRELTSTDRPLGAIFNSMMHTTGLRPGGRMQMRTARGGHTHRFTQMDDPVCRVVYDLKPVAGGIEVTLTVEDLPVGTKTAESMEKG